MTNYVLAMKWGNKYPALFVNRLLTMLEKNLRLPFEMVCLTDDSRGINSAVRCLPLPSLDLPAGLPERGWLKLTAFGPLPLEGTALFLDLDLVILRNIDHFFSYHREERDKLYIIKDFKHRRRITGNSSVYRFQLNAYPELLADFRANFPAIRRKFRNEQAFLSHWLHERQLLRYWPEGWCRSYKYHCLAPPPLDHFIAPRKPDCDILIFHGEINPDQAITGGGGKWYRHVKPAPWLADYWGQP